MGAVNAEEPQDRRIDFSRPVCFGLVSYVRTCGTRAGTKECRRVTATADFALVDRKFRREMFMAARIIATAGDRINRIFSGRTGYEDCGAIHPYDSGGAALVHAE